MKEDRKYIVLIRLRLIIGYLGENIQPAWWTSSFFAPGNTMFLSPIFSKTSILAQYHGIKEAATRIHDERIGIGKGVFHLFRLPDAIERKLHQLIINNEEIEQFAKTLTNKSEALNALVSLMDNNEISHAVGPVRIGRRFDLERIEMWKTVASYYQQAFQSQNQVFPFFSEVK